MTAEPEGAQQDSSEALGDGPVVRAKSLHISPSHLDALPELVPARMINEVLYCERLMYLEWVQSEWADNRFTVEGKAAHRRVDKPSKGLKVPVVRELGADDEKPYSARSVWLSSGRLGITSKLDIVEVDGLKVVPIEYKRGKEPASGPYLPERAQVAAQVMLLREHGYDCPTGEIYYAGEKRRVTVLVDGQLEAVVKGAVVRAKYLAAQGKCPPPLEDSPKCVGCSLAGICLPDEVRALQELPEDPFSDPVFDVGDDPWGLVGPAQAAQKSAPEVRRLYPARDDRVPLYVRGQGAAIRLSGGRITVMVPGQPLTSVRLGNTSSVTLYGNVQVTAQALRALMEENIPVLFASAGGWIVGRVHGADTKNIELRQAQFAMCIVPERRLQLAQAVTKAKILNSRTMLRRNQKEPDAVALRELQQFAKKVDKVESVESLLGIEGAAARAYFRAFPGMLKSDCGEGFQFDRRNRRPPTDPVNALLSFCYSLLSRETTVAAHAAGLDPLLGFFHLPRFGRPSLALDLMEEFRPILADSTVVTVINTGVVDPGDFVVGHGAVSLAPAARKRVIQAMERRLDQLVIHPIFDYRVSYRRVLEVQARLLSRVFLGELEHYPAFRVR